MILSREANYRLLSFDNSTLSSSKKHLISCNCDDIKRMYSTDTLASLHPLKQLNSVCSERMTHTHTHTLQMD